MIVSRFGTANVQAFFTTLFLGLINFGLNKNSPRNGSDAENDQPKHNDGEQFTL